MIIGGTDTPQWLMFKRTRTSTAEGGPTRDRMPEDTLAFSEEDLEAMTEPHNDALVISFLSNNTKMKRVLVDAGSSTNIIRSEVMGRLGLLDRVTPISRILHGFNMIDEVAKGEVTLSIDKSGAIQNTKFQVIDGDMRYNALLDRPWIHGMRAVPSTLHQMIKFPTKDGVTTIYGEQRAAKEMFAVCHEVSAPRTRFLESPGTYRPPRTTKKTTPPLEPSSHPKNRTQLSQQ
ncbi:PREDICTED: uncharacterized protein LOC109236017 [Nicotiana attenuata]|uniref:uncharacterized protein LOC109236017 n=1 Tax=Nicotiana attenuata TaxID=49451 RepID=UPI00090544D5|nr:PREDICTED: uncharacterized protein LOC109236017 [Nicotiana attenuata]